MNQALALIAANTVLGGGLTLGLLMAPHAPAAHAAPAGVDAYAYEVGDGNGDGRIEEDESGFDCRTMGNRICGVGAVLPDGTLAIPGDWSTTDAEGNLVPPHADGPFATPDPFAFDAGAYVGGYN